MIMMMLMHHNIIECLSMTFTADCKRQRLTLIFYFFSCNPYINHTKIKKVSLTIHCKDKYFDSTGQRAVDRRQKFHFCRLP